jgi:hypothetical protein
MAHWNLWFAYWKCWFSTAMWVYECVFFCERFFQILNNSKPFWFDLQTLFCLLDGVVFYPLTLQNGSLQDPILSLEGDNFGFLGCPMIFCPPEMVQKIVRTNCRTKSDTLAGESPRNANHFPISRGAFPLFPLPCLLNGLLDTRRQGKGM